MESPVIKLEGLVLRAGCGVEGLAAARLCRLVLRTVQDQERQLDARKLAFEPFVGADQCGGGIGRLALACDQGVAVHGLDDVRVAREVFVLQLQHAKVRHEPPDQLPEDSFENMKRFAKAHDFPFPYLHDETQTVARAYGAVCTPDFFGYNADRKLKYRGRLDEGRTTPPRTEAPRELVEAMRAIATTGVAPADQKASVGCSIKWKDE